MTPLISRVIFIVVFIVVLLAVYMPGATFIAPGFVLYIFPNVGIYSFVVPAGRNVTVDVLIVAGGGGGGAGVAGSGGGIFKNVSCVAYCFV